MKLLDTSEKNFLLADSSKFERKNLIKLGELSQVDILFTDKLQTLLSKLLSG